jgi:hypothetical protein
MIRRRQASGGFFYAVVMPAKAGIQYAAALPSSPAYRRTGSSAGACHRAAIRPTRWRMMTTEVAAHHERNS